MNSQKNQLVHDFLERSAERTPDKTALVHEGRRQRIPHIVDPDAILRAIVIVASHDVRSVVRET